jgi:hypothetical protein
VSFGKELPDGTVADKNYVWLSEWQLENINNNHLLPIDYESYTKLKNHIVKALIPILQVGLYATRYATQDTEDLRFEKSYHDLCAFLGIKPFLYLSQIRQQVKPSLDELKNHGYISKWTIEPTADQQDYKIIFYHGKKFHQDHDRRKEQKAQVQPPRAKSAATPKRPAMRPPAAVPTDLLSALIQFGFIQDVAEEILSQHPDAEIRRQLAF